MTEPKYTAQQAAEGMLFYDTLKSVPEDKQDRVFYQAEPQDLTALRSVRICKLEDISPVERKE